MQKLIQVSDYDVWYLDNFYDDPDQVRNLALNSKYEPYGVTNYPGIRTENMGMDQKYNDPKLKQFYLEFLNFFSEKISVVHGKKFKLDTSFHRIPVYDKNLKSVLNTGYIHVDGQDHIKKNNKKVYAGLVYLNKKTFLKSGTSIFKIKESKIQNGIKITDSNNWDLCEQLFYPFYYDDFFDEYCYLYNPLTKRKYWNYFLQNKNFVDSKFEKVLEIENVYNRLVLYDSAYFHTASHFYVNDFEERLTQPFFIRML